MIARFEGFSVNLKLTLLKICGDRNLLKFQSEIFHAQADFLESFMVTTNISPSQNIKKLVFVIDEDD
jgi:hypothetical protein